MADEINANVPIKTDDAASMLRRKAQNNDRPYIAETTRANNKRVDDWKKKVLNKIADQRGSVPAARVWGCWQLYDEGKSIQKYMELKNQGMLVPVPGAVLDFWKDFFENKTVEEMHAYGSGTVSYGWSIVKQHIQTWFIEQKWDRLYSKSDDPLWWERNYHPHKGVLDGDILPFWTHEKLDDISQKVGAILFNPVSVQGSGGIQKR